jgi:hypothetical protein
MIGPGLDDPSLDQRLVSDAHSEALASALQPGERVLCAAAGRIKCADDLEAACGLALATDRGLLFLAQAPAASAAPIEVVSIPYADIDALEMQKADSFGAMDVLVVSAQDGRVVKVGNVSESLDSLLRLAEIAATRAPVTASSAPTAPGSHRTRRTSTRRHRH